jgi:hypothetical protein
MDSPNPFAAGTCRDWREIGENRWQPLPGDAEDPSDYLLGMNV